MIRGIADRVLALHGLVALLLVFVLAALECSAFVGIVVPGEIAVVLGGVLAFEGRIPLWGAIVAAVSGAIIGDTIGYFIGKRWGRQILHRASGRLIKPHHLDRAEAYLRRRGGSAVFFGRFTAALRVLVPGLAGMSNLHYPTFLAYNAAGAIAWGSGFVLLGFFAGASWRRVERVATRAGLILLGLVLFALILSWAIRTVRRRSAGWRRARDRLAESTTIAWLRRRFPGQSAWLARRLDLARPTGIPFTVVVVACVLSAWALASLIAGVVTNTEAVGLDPAALRFVVAHRSDFLKEVTRAARWVGSVPFLLALVLGVGGAFLLRHRKLQPGVALLAALGGTILWQGVARSIIERARPPAQFWIGIYSGSSFPSPRAAQALATFAMMAFLLSSGRSRRTWVLLWAGAAIVAALVGASEVYVAAHWLTDVLGAYSLAGTWFFLLVGVIIALRVRAVAPPISAGGDAEGA